MFYILLKYDRILLQQKEIKMYKNIEFIASTEDSLSVFDKPAPAKRFIPKWYKNQSRYTGSDKMTLGSNGNPNHTIKACMPVLDVLTAGYIITMPADVYFSRDNDGGMQSTWSTDLIRAIESHPVEQYNEFSVPEGYDKNALKIIQPWIIKTPPGYSCLFLQPSYRDDLPFMILPAIVDTDKHPLPINFPFFIKNGFEGVVEYGTPIMQVIPFKRENWTHSFSADLNGNAEKIWQSAKRKISNRYKTFYRSKKNWN